MELAEQETIILINNEDKKDGFFKISTSLASVAQSIKRRFKDDIIKTNCPRQDGKEVYWDFWIKVDALADAPFIARKRVLNLSEEQRQAKSENLARLRKEQLRTGKKGLENPTLG